MRPQEDEINKMLTAALMFGAYWYGFPAVLALAHLLSHWFWS